MLKALPEILVGTFLVFLLTFLSSYFGFAPTNMAANIAAELVFFRVVYLAVHFLFSLKNRRHA
ncbi:hypothetical protein LNP00_01425 [Fructobacillus sp. M158]|uniref:hypothetical protein n=1 Tax=Fructobacillus parabroussonetiae TaxID=2713174 RepID=UPI002009E4A3|nr:hypothetical protein [Fructobacillus parabroussonetiae]MCK8617032.1 hypothetical protein [Fructobacillus parabroussonetiae]